ncbi:hypothetical protein [Archangium sp.]|uniref:hypothetical protein n=1 Tax=Archangium sp. TaxID=1872627 RepID=UPI003899CEA0
MEPSSNITFDDSLWPLLVIRFTGMPTNQQFDDFLAKRGASLARRQKHVVIYDTGSFRVLSPEQRQRLINWFRERKAIQKQLSIGSALVITSPVTRLLLSSILQFTQTETPYHVARSVSEAAQWAAARLDEAGLFADAQRVRVHHGAVLRRSTG